MKHIWQYNGASYPFDISESGNVDRMHQGLNALRGDLRQLGVPGEGDAGGALKEQCLIIRRFFDTVLGDGCGETICGTAFSADAHTTAYVAFIGFVNEQVTAFREKMAEVEAKYMERAETADAAYDV